jgi:glycosyltransferase involved in cell wall biosynthesis
MPAADRKRLFVVTECYPRPQSPRHCIFAHRQMVGLAESGWEVQVLRPVGWRPRGVWPLARAWREAAAEAIPGGWTIDGVSVAELAFQNRVPSRLNRPLDAHSRVVEALVSRLEAERADPQRDALLVQFALPYGPAVREAARRTGLRYAVYLRGDDVWILPHRDGAKRLEPFREAVGEADLVLAVSRALVEGAREIVGDPFPPSAVVPNGIALERFRPASEEERERLRAGLGIARGETVVCSVGDALVRKGWLDLLDALGALPAESGRLHLLGAFARGEDEIDVHAEAARRAPRVALTLRRNLPADELAALYRAADLFCLPSHWEGLANALLEAMASGLACVTTAIAGHPEALTNGVEGFLVEPKRPDLLVEPIARLVASPELRREMGAAARRRAEAIGDSRRAGERLDDLLDRMRRGRLTDEALDVDPYRAPHAGAPNEAAATLERRP